MKLPCSFDLLDNEKTDIAATFEESIDFIKTAKEMGGRILVHCIAGVSRSSSVVLAYLMKEEGWDLYTAYEYAKKRRFIVKPNKGFRLQLARYELTVHDVSTVARTKAQDWNFPK